MLSEFQIIRGTGGTPGVFEGRVGSVETTPFADSGRATQFISYLNHNRITGKTNSGFRSDSRDPNGSPAER
jgi:hypothetical protein